MYQLYQLYQLYQRLYGLGDNNASIKSIKLIDNAKTNWTEIVLWSVDLTNSSYPHYNNMLSIADI